MQEVEFVVVKMVYVKANQSEGGHKAGHSKSNMCRTGVLIFYVLSLAPLGIWRAEGISVRVLLRGCVP